MEKPKGILATCELLHMIIQETSEGYDQEFVQELYDSLVKSYKSWSDVRPFNNPTNCFYEQAVKNLLTVTIAEANVYINEYGSLPGFKHAEYLT